MEPVTQIVHKQKSFMATVAWGISLVAVTGIICASSLALYGLRVLDKRMDDLPSLMRSVAESLPELREALPPILDDALRDERRPEYREKLETSVKMSLRPASDKTVRPVVRVKNNGDQTVSWLPLHVTVYHGEELLFDYDAWAATPLSCDGDMRGPLLPGSEREFPVGYGIECHTVQPEDLRAEVEIGDVRVWTPNPADSPYGEKPELLSEVEKPGGCDHAPK